MRKTTLFVGMLLLALASCNQEGEILVQPKHITLTNGKQITVTKVCPCDDCEFIWVAYARDSSNIVTINHGNTETTSPKAVISVTE